MKKYLVVIMAVLMALCLCACGKSEAVKEARERVRIAVRQMGIRFPAKRITVNLSPANLRKEGTSFDLPIAISLLTAFGHLSNECTENILFIGELGLDGTLHSVNGVLAMVLAGRKQGIRHFVVPSDNVCEAAILPDIELYGIAKALDVPITDLFEERNI